VIRTKLSRRGASRDAEPHACATTIFLTVWLRQLPPCFVGMPSAFSAFASSFCRFESYLGSQNKSSANRERALFAERSTVNIDYRVVADCHHYSVCATGHARSRRSTSAKSENQAGRINELREELGQDPDAQNSRCSCRAGSGVSVLPSCVLSSHGWRLLQHRQQ
jgi:hypothetical protein